MIAFLLGLAAVAQAQPTTVTASPAPNADPVICHRPESEVGTHMRPKPVCMKKSDWDLVEKNTQEQLRILGERSNFDPGKSGSSH